jgi:hypothetical protein
MVVAVVVQAAPKLASVIDKTKAEEISSAFVML